MASAKAPPAPPQPKKKWGTGTIILVVFCCFVGVGVIAAGIGVYLVMSSEKGRAIVGIVGDGYEMIQKGRTAPGMDELRKMGCQDAVVTDSEALERMVKRLDDGGDHGRAPFGEIVTCTISIWGKALECDDLAREYVSRAGPRERSFFVNVQKTGEGKPHCSAFYDGSGVRKTTGSAIADE